MSLSNLELGAAYRLENAWGETVMDLSAGDNKSIIGWGWHGGDNQKVRIYFFVIARLIYELSSYTTTVVVPYERMGW